MAQKSLKIFFKAAFLVAIFAAAFYLAQIAKDSEMAREIVFSYGYFGIFAIAVVSGFNLAFPVPAIAFLPLFLESGLNFWTTIIFIVLGSTLADSITYVVGRFGRQMLAPYESPQYMTTTKTTEKKTEQGSFRTGLAPRKNIKIINVLEKTTERHWWAPTTLLFLFASLVPLPNEILVVPLGFLNYKFSRVWPPILAGNFIFNLIYSAGVVGLFEVL